MRFTVLRSKLLHVSLRQLISASTSKLYSYNTLIGSPKFNVSDASRRLFSRLFKGTKHGSSYRGKNYIENDLRGNENWFELAKVRVIGSRLYFWRNSRCFIWWWNTVLNAWYYFSKKKKILKEEIEDAKMSSFSSDFQTLIKH